MVVELLNTGIESAIDRIGPEWHELAKRARADASAPVPLRVSLRDYPNKVKLDELLAERGEMLDVLAHEVRQPLNNASAAMQSASAALKEVGNVAAFLLSDLASGLTAEITYVDGGFSQTGGASRDSEPVVS